MKYILTFIAICLIIGAFIVLWSMATQQIAIEQARAITAQAGAIDTLSKTVQTLADDYSQLVHAQTQQMQIQSAFLLLAALAIGAETMVLLIVGAVIAYEKLRNRNPEQPQRRKVLTQAARPELQPGHSVIIWPDGRREIVNSEPTRGEEYYGF